MRSMSLLSSMETTDLRWNGASSPPPGVRSVVVSLASYCQASNIEYMQSMGYVQEDLNQTGFVKVVKVEAAPWLRIGPLPGGWTICLPWCRVFWSVPLLFLETLVKTRNLRVKDPMSSPS